MYKLFSLRFDCEDSFKLNSNFKVMLLALFFSSSSAIFRSIVGNSISFVLRKEFAVFKKRSSYFPQINE